jgi:mannose-6-phosphate isomerase-like protein (cupin superfamily)
VKRHYFFVLPILCCVGAAAQSGKVDFYTAADLASREKALGLKLDASTGSAGSTLEKYPHHLTMFILREKSGQSEMHAKVADVFIAVDGSAELWTGGKMLQSKTTEPNEERGEGLEGGTKVSLEKGDIVHIAAGVPHQLRIAPGGHFAYFVVKSQEIN